MEHVGEEITIYGPVKGTFYSEGSKGKPIFVNIGNSDSNANRFTVVIWGEDRINFEKAPEKLYANKTIYVTGKITIYEGVAQMIIDKPYQIEY